MKLSKHRHHSNPVVDTSADNREALNPAPGILRTSPFRRAFSAAILLSNLTFSSGVVMAKHAVAQEKEQVSDLERLRSQINDDMIVIKSYSSTADSERAFTRLFQNLSSLNKLLEKNKVPSAIPEMKGDSNYEKRMALNHWLGIAEDTAPPSTMGTLARKLVEIDSALKDSKGSTTMLAAVAAMSKTKETLVAEAPVKAAEAPVKATEAPVKAPVVEAPKPQVATPAPSTVAAVVPQPVITLADRIEDLKLIKNLQYIVDNTPKKSKTHSAASNHLKRLEDAAKESAATQKKNKAKTEQKITVATAFIDKNLAKVEAEVLRKGMQTVPPGEADTFMAEIDALHLSDKNDPAHRIRQLLPDLFLSGVETRARAMALLKEAVVSPAAYGHKCDEAKAVFANEQMFLLSMLKTLEIPMAESIKAKLQEKDSHGQGILPTFKQLKEMGSADSMDYAKKSNKRNNGVDDMVVAMDARIKAAKDLVKKGKVSYFEVAALYEALESEDRTVGGLVDACKFVRKRFDIQKAPPQARKKFWSAYSIAASTISDPDKNPYVDMSKEQRRALVAPHKEGVSVADAMKLSDKEFAVIEKEVMPGLMRLLEIRQNDVMQNVFEATLSVVRSSDEFKRLSQDPKLKLRADLRSARAVADKELERFRVGYYYVDGERKHLAPTEQLDARFSISRVYLEDVKDMLPPTDPMRVKAEAWLAAVPRMPKERAVEVSELLVQKANCIAAIVDAKMNIADFESRLATMKPEAAAKVTIDAAKKALDIATEIFDMDFSGANKNPEYWVFPGYHFNVASLIADRVTNMLAPSAFAITEAPATHYSIAAYENPQDFVHCSDEAKPTLAERRQAAAEAELRHMCLLSILRGEAGFGASGSKELMRRLDMLGPMGLLNFEVGRINPVNIVTLLSNYTGEYPLLAVSDYRKRTSVGPADEHYVRSENVDPSNTAMRSRNIFNRPHENPKQYHAGQVYIELLRLTNLHGDSETPAILVNLNRAPSQITDAGLRRDIAKVYADLKLDEKKPFLVAMRDKMLDASVNYSSKALVTQQQDLNNLMLGVLDARIAELRALAGGSIKIKDGTVSVKALAQYKDPRAAYARNALKTLVMLTGADGKSGIRAQLAAGAKSDLLEAPIDHRTAIVMAEKGMASLDPKNFAGMTREDNALAVFDYPKVEREQYHNEANVRFANFKVVGQNVNVGEPGRETTMSREEYEKQRGVDVLLRYGWIAYEEFPGNVIMVANPRRKASSESTVHEPAFVGRVMRNISLPDGTVGDAVVRVEAKSERTAADYSKAMDYETVTKDGKYDILYVLQKPKTGGEISYLPVSLDSRARNMAMKAGGKTFSLPTGADARAIALPLIEKEEKK